ncbi:MAG: glycosyltransferase [Candidatus Omnitrophica bacterium]|nr:glycosyltransferase [Candidatus Omnitrophota bacterium]
MDVNVIILQYGTARLLEECLPSIIAAQEASLNNVTVTVLDNNRDESAENLIRQKFPSVTYARAPINKVLCSFNDYVKTLSDEVVILLNNDIKVDRGFIDPLAECFRHADDIFFVSSKSCRFDGSYEGGRSHAFMRWGIFGSDNSYKGADPRIERKNITFAAGFGAFDRKKFLELGGYDELYLPGRLEDADLCFRAWKKGYRSLYEPRSVVYHKGAESFRREFGISGTLVINFRNTFLFMWKNIRDPQYLLSHIIFLMPRLLLSLLKGKPELFLGFLQAIPLGSRALKERRCEKGPYARSDKDVFGIFLSDNYTAEKPSNDFAVSSHACCHE